MWFWREPSQHLLQQTLNTLYKLDFLFFFFFWFHWQAKLIPASFLWQERNLTGYWHLAAAWSVFTFSKWKCSNLTFLCSTTCVRIFALKVADFLIYILEAHPPQSMSLYIFLMEKVQQLQYLRIFSSWHENQLIHYSETLIKATNAVWVIILSPCIHSDVPVWPKLCYKANPIILSSSMYHVPQSDVCWGSIWFWNLQSCFSKFVSRGICILVRIQCFCHSAAV